MSKKQKAILLLIIVILNFLWDIRYPIPPEEVNPPNYFFILIAMFPLLMGFWFIHDFFKNYNLAKDSLHWQKYEGKMLKKAVHASASSNVDKRMSDYQPRVNYSLKPYGVELTLHNINFFKTAPFNNEEAAQAVLDALPKKGEKIDVYFSIEHDKGVLIPGTKGMNYPGFIAGFFVFSIGLWILKLAI